MGAGATPAGWYPDVERPGGERYWDGTLWTEQRRGGEPPPAPGFPPQGGQQPPVYGQPPPSGQQPPGYGQPPGAFGQQPYGQAPYGAPMGYQSYAGNAYPQASNAGLALGLSIGSIFLMFVCCIGVFMAVPALIMGRNGMKAADEGRMDPAGRGQYKAAFIISVVVISLTLTLVALYAVLIIAGTA
jgi:hypothetical protein